MTPTQLIAELARDPECQWSMGAFGAAGSFRPAKDTAVSRRGERFVLCSPLAALSIDCRNLRPVAFEAISSEPTSWNHGIALCVAANRLPFEGTAGIGRRRRDTGALMDAEIDAATFDIGLGSGQASVSLRSADPGVIALMARLQGKDFLALPQAEHQEIAASSVDWIFETAIGRLEVRSEPAACPPACFRPAFIAPNLLASGLTHAHTTALPEGLVPCGYAFPPHPARHGPGLPMAFDPLRHERFQAIFDRFGRPDLVRLKRRVETAVHVGGFDPTIRRTREEHAAVRVALRQHLMARPDTDLTPWLAAFDHALLRELQGPERGGA